MKKWWVIYPIAGTVEIEVEAKTEKEAIDKALDVWSDLPESEQNACITEWEFFTRLTEGNVLHAPVNEAYAEEIKDD